ncbi:GNAT family N-acetyltransferase [Paracoccus sp. (in: a-proteobacteria)]|uniref:GNAT family N-acetyltransferase n=1 Tax=Paracoccus sp. TaxID=267 RepID=UPI0026DF63BB|nr:GNAT family N-acetyltransferase [Paracoccus sp. (in: a-proteobacteria)]MDO5647612.1 GNAT family N-acetyltransferase [Paracoccus sp. (in: a-proteobacteria)]
MNITETNDLATCHALRRAVFINEQNVPEAEEMDDLDDQAIHLLAWQDGQAVGTARLLFDGDLGKIGRVCVLASARGTGLGAALIRASMEVLRARGMTRAKLGAQTHAIGFYQGLGFAAYGPVYDDAGIPHRDMIRDL